MSKKEVATLLISGAAITSAVFAAPLTGGLSLINPEILGEGMKTLGGLGGNLVANAVQKHFIENHPQEDVLKNGDLTRAVGSAIFKLCGKLAEETSDGNDKKSLEKLAATKSEVWEDLLIGGGYEEGYGLSLSYKDLSGVSAEKLVQYINAKAENLDEIKSLTSEEWQGIIATLCEKQQCWLSKDAKTGLANKLHLEFAKALRKVLIDDFNKDGKAFASMQFRVLSEILFYTKQNYELNDSILPIVIEILKKVEDINQNAPKNYSLENKANWEKIFTDFDSFIEIQKKTYENTEEIKADVKKILKNQQNQSIQKSSRPNGLVNISVEGKKFFTEQGTVLADLETQLNRKHIACLHGKHGLGKTTNVEEFARRQIGNYELIVFLNAAEPIIETSIKDFADRYVPELKKLSLVEREQVQFETKLKLFTAFLEDNELWQGEKRGWLLIFDNLERNEHLRRYFPNTNNGDILYTCNDVLYLDESCEVPIEEFSFEEAELFLYKIKDERKGAKHEEIPSETLADIHKILQHYGRLPFVVNKFRTYLSQIPISYAAFYEELNNNEQRYFELPASHEKNYYKNEIIAFSVSFDKIKPQENQSQDDQIISRLAVEMLNISAFCFAEQIPEEILKETLFRIVETSETTLSKQILFAEAFRLLQRFDLLNSKTVIFEYLEKRETPEIVYVPYKQEETVYHSHRTIQKIVKLNLKNDIKKDILNEIIVVLLSFIPWVYLETWKIYEKYLSNAENIIEEARKINLATPDIGYICNQFALYQDNIAQYEKAIQFYQEALLIGEKTIGKEHPNYAIRLNNLALVYDSQGKYDEAIELYKQALLIDEKTIGKEHPAYAIDLNNLANVYNSQGKYEEAIELYKQALLIGEKTIGKEHPAYATRLNNLALVYKSQGKYEEAIELYKQALLIDEKTIGKEHPAYATRLNNLANVYKSQGKYEEAIELYKQALLIGEKTIGKKHPNYASGLNNLASVYNSQGKYEEAIELYKQALLIGKKTIGKEHPEYAIRLGNLAFAYENQGKYQEALDLFEEALRIREKTLPENHPYTIQDKESVAWCRAMLGK